MNEAEVWRPIPEFPNYEASSMGRIRSLPGGQRGKGRIMKVHVNNISGYPGLIIFRNGKEYYRPVHALMLSAFCGPRPSPQHQGRHLDGSRTNNILNNLAWGTPKENTADSIRHGTWAHGEKCRKKLKEHQVLLIRELAPQFNIKQLARMFSIAKTTTTDILKRKIWKHI